MSVAKCEAIKTVKPTIPLNIASQKIAAIRQSAREVYFRIPMKLRIGLMSGFPLFCLISQPCPQLRQSGHFLSGSGILCPFRHVQVIQGQPIIVPNGVHNALLRPGCLRHLKTVNVRCSRPSCRNNPERRRVTGAGASTVGALSRYPRTPACGSMETAAYSAVQKIAAMRSSMTDSYAARDAIRIERRDLGSQRRYGTAQPIPRKSITALRCHNRGPGSPINCPESRA